ncbi:immunity 17 family protein, partial [Bacteroides sp.]
MTPHYIVQAIFALGGAVALLAALFNWEWFFGARNAQSVVRSVGRPRARWFYGVVGA